MALMTLYFGVLIPTWVDADVVKGCAEILDHFLRLALDHCLDLHLPEGLSGIFLTSLLQLIIQQNSATAPYSQPSREHSAHSVLQSLRSGSAELFSAHLEMPSAFLHWGMDASRVVCDHFTLKSEQYTITKISVDF